MSNTLLLLFEKESQIAQAGLELCLPKHDLEFLILLFSTAPELGLQALLEVKLRSLFLLGKHQVS